VTGFKPQIITDLSTIGPTPIPNLIIIGSMDKSPLIQRLASQNMVPPALKGKWESYVIKTIRHPVIGVGRALVITGSDRRGTAYGIFELSRQMGVSPWYWWADVPVTKHNPLFVRSIVVESAPPAVKYR